MRKRITLPPIAFLVMFILLMGCHKFIDIKDIWHQHNPDCRIEEIMYHPVFGPDTVYARFNYNHKGYPTSILFSHVTSGRPNELFKYDMKGRLTDYIGPYENNNHYEFWYRYQFDGKGRIISDSVYVFGETINGQPSDNTLISPGSYEYDAFDRVRKVKRSYPPPAAGTAAYAIIDEYLYNAAGNLEVHNQYFNTIIAGSDSTILTGSDTLQYDNKVNIRRTNKLWMFLDRDYSKNNAIPAAELYNKQGLPLRYRLPTGNFGPRFLHAIELGHSDINYRCK